MDVSVVRTAGRGLPLRELARFAREVARLVPPPRGRASLGVALVGDARMRRWNRIYRKEDRTTDVLAFPAGSDPSARRHLGDIAISVPRAREQARRAGHGLGREVRLLILHGYLHLLGYDHETDGGEMARLQRRIEQRLLEPAGRGR